MSIPISLKDLLRIGSTRIFKSSSVRASEAAERISSAMRAVFICQYSFFAVFGSAGKSVTLQFYNSLIILEKTVNVNFWAEL
jgi:hypothetical protein